MNLGYARVSTGDQPLDLHLEASARADRGRILVKTRGHHRVTSPGTLADSMAMAELGTADRAAIGGGSVGPWDASSWCVQRLHGDRARLP